MLDDIESYKLHKVHECLFWDELIEAQNWAMAIKDPEVRSDAYKAIFDHENT
jgi:hypothetical protein